MNKIINEYHSRIVFYPFDTLSEKLDELKLDSKTICINYSDKKESSNEFIIRNGYRSEEIALQLATITKIPSPFWIKKLFMFDKFRFIMS